MVDFEKLEANDWYTITGVGGDEQEWKDGYQKLLDEKGIGTIKEWTEFTGKQMNERYGLTEKNAYQDDLHFLAFSLDGMDIGKLAIFKLQMGDRWFSDIVANNEDRQKEINKRRK